MNTTPGPYATTREDGVIVIADDADWTVPGIHNRYRAALQSALTRHVWNWQADGDGGLVSRSGCWSPRYVWLRQGVVAVSSKEDPDCVTEFAIRKSEIEALDTRVEQIRRALEGLADNTATEINGGGEPVRSDEYGDVKLDSGEVIPGDGTCPSHLSDKNWPRDLRALSEEKSFLEELVSLIPGNLIPGLTARAEAMRASTAALAENLTGIYQEHLRRGLTATEETAIRETPVAGHEPWEVELTGICELDDEETELATRKIMRDRVEALRKRCTPRLTNEEVRLYEGTLNLAFPLVEQALAVCEVDVLRHRDGVWELARRMVEPGELLGELDDLAMAQVMPVLAQKLVYRAIWLGVIDWFPSDPCPEGNV